MDKKLVGLFSLFFLVFTFFAIIVLGREPILSSIKAKEDKEPSATSSIILAWPLTAKVNLHSTITVFVRSQSGKPLPGRLVTFSTTLGNIRPATVTSDDTGRAEAILTCDQPGIARLGAVIENTTSINQNITVECQ